MGIPLKGMVYKGKKTHRSKWMMTGATPMTQETPNQFQLRDAQHLLMCHATQTPATLITETMATVAGFRWPLIPCPNDTPQKNAVKNVPF